MRRHEPDFYSAALFHTTKVVEFIELRLLKTNCFDQSKKRMLKFLTSPIGPKGQTSTSVPAVAMLMSSDPRSRGKSHAAIFSHRR